MYSRADALGATHLFYQAQAQRWVIGAGHIKHLKFFADEDVVHVEGSVLEGRGAEPWSCHWSVPAVGCVQTSTVGDPAKVDEMVSTLTVRYWESWEANSNPIHEHNF